MDGEAAQETWSPWNSAREDRGNEPGRVIETGGKKKLVKVFLISLFLRFSSLPREEENGSSSARGSGPFSSPHPPGEAARSRGHGEQGRPGLDGN